MRATHPLVYQAKLAFDLSSRKGVGSRGWYGDMAEGQNSLPIWRGVLRSFPPDTSPDKLRSGGLITGFDVEKRSLRKFNLTTLVGRLTALSPEGPASFYA